MIYLDIVVVVAACVGSYTSKKIFKNICQNEDRFVYLTFLRTVFDCRFRFKPALFLRISGNHKFCFISMWIENQLATLWSRVIFHSVSSVPQSLVKSCFMHFRYRLI